MVVLEHAAVCVSHSFTCVSASICVCVVEYRLQKNWRGEMRRMGCVCLQTYNPLIPHKLGCCIGCK